MSQKNVHSRKMILSPFKAIIFIFGILVYVGSSSCQKQEEKCLGTFPVEQGTTYYTEFGGILSGTEWGDDVVFCEGKKETDLIEIDKAENPGYMNFLFEFEVTAKRYFKVMSANTRNDYYSYTDNCQ